MGPLRGVPLHLWGQRNRTASFPEGAVKAPELLGPSGKVDSQGREGLGSSLGRREGNRGQQVSPDP